MKAREGGDWRLFVAVPVGEEVRRAAAVAIARLQQALETPGDWRWQDRAMLHVTLAFLGNVASANVPALARSLTGVARRARPMALSCDGLGGFPSPRRARVLWYGVLDPDGELAALARDIRDAMGLSAGEDLRGHITLARLRSDRSADVRSALQVEAPRARLAIDSVRLYRSASEHGRLEYQSLAVCRLG